MQIGILCHTLPLFPGNNSMDRQNEQGSKKVSPNPKIFSILMIHFLPGITAGQNTSNVHQHACRGLEE